MKRKQVQDFFAAVACACGLHTIWRRLMQRRLLVLVYHGVTADALPDDAPAWHHVPSARFREQIAWLRRHYDILDIDTGLERLRRGEIRKPTACITFDDGYLNNKTVALPVLAEHRAPATIYLVTGMIGTDRRLWTVEMETALRRSSVDHIDLSMLDLGVRPLNEMADRVSAAREIGRAIKNRPAAQRQGLLAAIHALIDGKADNTSGQFQLMSWEDVAAMERSGLVTFGAHTVNHECLSRLGNDDLAYEIGESWRAIREHVERPSRTFAYPNGGPQDFDDRAPQTLQSAGLDWALTTIEGLNDTGTDAYRIRRVTVENDTTFARFRLAASGVLESIRRFRKGRPGVPDARAASD